MEAATNTPAPAQPAKLSNNNYFVVLLLISLLVVGGGAFATKTLISGIGHDSKVASAKNKAKTQLDSDVGAAPQLVSSYQALSASTALTLKDALPTTSDFPGLISLLESAGARAGMDVSSIAPTTDTGSTAVASTTGAQPYTIGVQASGSYGQLLAFLNNLELSARPIQVTSIELAGATSSINASITLTTYYQAKATLPFSTEVIK